MAPTARLLDITRLSSRIGRVFTGVDRVELAYLKAIHADEVPDFAIARTALGYVLLNHEGIAAALSLIGAKKLPRPDFISRINRRLSHSAKIGQTILRRNAMKRCARRKLSAMLSDSLPAGFAYLNVGHSNLTEGMLSAIKEQADARVTVLLHDAIPLAFPEFQRLGTVETFAGKIRRVSRYADQVICVSQAGQADIRPHLKIAGRVPPMTYAHIGIDMPEKTSLPRDIPLDRPYFVTVGTIEPRKNHALLLDLWEQLDAPAPRLFVCGPRGWNNADVFRRLDNGVADVTEFAGLSDGALASLVAGARALLFPTRAEGFGLPPAEALSLGTPVLCSDLPVLKEILDQKAVYLDPTDVYQWKKEVLRLASVDGSPEEIDFAPPTWDAHFKIVFTMT